MENLKVQKCTEFRYSNCIRRVYRIGKTSFCLGPNFLRKIVEIWMYTRSPIIRNLEQIT